MDGDSAGSVVWRGGSLFETEIGKQLPFCGE